MILVTAYIANDFSDRVPVSQTILVTAYIANDLATGYLYHKRF